MTPDLPFAPADVTAASPVWLSDPRWPLPLANTRAMLAGLYAAHEQVRCGADPYMDDVITLAETRIVAVMGAYAEAAMLCEAAAGAGYRFESAHPAIAWLQGTSEHWPKQARQPTSQAPAGLWKVRNWLRTGTLNRKSLVPRALWSPQHVAISHNHLLVDVAQRFREAVGFCHPHFYSGGDAAIGAEDFDRLIELSRTLTRALSSVPRVGAALMQRLDPIFKDVVEREILGAARELARLNSLKSRLPSSMWRGTGGHYASRALSIAVRRHGGDVTGFDHGGCSGLLEWNVLGELECRVATRFVTSTAITAQCIEDLETIKSLSAAVKPKIVGHDGDPTFAAAAALRTGKVKKSNPRVLYVIGHEYGFRQWFPPMLPDVLYDYVMKSTVRSLLSMPIELVCRPRPSAGGNHPIEAIAKCDYRAFHSAVRDADVVVYDDVHSTSFWETLCTDRPVVLLDLSLNRFTISVKRKIEKRVSVVRAKQDERNIPRFDRTELESAILGGLSAADPQPIVEILARGQNRSAAI